MLAPMFAVSTSVAAGIAVEVLGAGWIFITPLLLVLAFVAWVAATSARR
jgi:hypothetical protein